jgi:outer membrane protein OmpA-like peptidoglycan-associated protein
MDIKACDKQDVFTFERERNTAWYSFIIQEEGDLILEIISVNPKNDYDFMLFKWTDTCFCDNVKQGYLLPVRTNLSHSENKFGVPMTGLSAKANEEHVRVGVGEEFSKSLLVKKGEKYYLAIDNVNAKGQGHTIKMYYLKEITVSGTVIDDRKKSVAGATIWVENASENVVDVTKSDDEGRYSLSAKIKDDEYYSLLYTSDSSFIECRQIILADFSKTNYIQKDLKTIVPRLERGKKYILDGISYNKSTGRLHPGSFPTLNALTRLMLKYKGLKVQIEGHVNNPKIAANTGEDKVLGQKRADEIYDYLLYKGVANTRIVPTTFGSLFMIYPRPSTPAEIDANNRIEIFFLPDK